MKWLWRGLGVGIGLACWPLLIPLLLLCLLGAIIKRAAPLPPPSPPSPGPQRPYMLRELRAIELAKVERRNRDHLERCLGLGKKRF